MTLTTPIKPSPPDRTIAARIVEVVVWPLQKCYRMPKKQAADNKAATAADIERSILALNKMAERLWGDGREVEAKALLDALDGLNRALDRIRIGESRRIKTLH